MAPALRIRPYKDFLTPLLHKRFMRAAGILGLLCYVEALFLGQWNGWFWSWIPFGLAGIRTGLLFICAFVIFVLRVGQLHVGLRTTNSPVDTFRQYAFRLQTIQTPFWYWISAVLFDEVYRWSAPKEANIYWVTEAKNNELRKLNERAVYLNAYFISLGFIQAGFHLYYDYDRIDMPITKTKSQSASDQRAHPTVPPYIQLKKELPALLFGAAKRAFIMTLIGPVIYSVTIRRARWIWSLFWARIWWKLPRSSSLPLIGPFHWQILWRTFAGGFLLIFMWEVGNAAFSIYVAQEPLKNERPITYESRDPNGSLLTGLRGKKLQTRAFAMWELVYIAQRFQGRRKTIFEDIDRKGGSTWSQILEICLGIINGISSRITEHFTPLPAPAVQVVQDIPTLPRLSAPLQDLKDDKIFTASPPPKSKLESIGATVGSITKAHGQSSNSPQPLKFIGQAKSKILSLDHQKASSSEGIWAKAHKYALQFVKSPLGWPFRQSFSRRISVVVLGSPYGDTGIIVDAIDSLTRLSVCSLAEDPFGNVSNDVPKIIRTFTTVVAQIEGFKQNLGIHWTDVEKKQASPQVDIILAALKGGLNELLEAFGDYSVDLRLSQSDLRMARDAATPPRLEEMKQK